MGRPASPFPRVRMSLDIAAGLRESLERLQVLLGAESLTEVIRRSVLAFEKLLNAERRGAAIVIREKDGTDNRVAIR